jgi:hypothetical protein
MSLSIGFLLEGYLDACVWGSVQVIREFGRIIFLMMASLPKCCPTWKMLIILKREMDTCIYSPCVKKCVMGLYHKW